MPKKDLEAAIKWEAKKFIPLPIEEMILDWKILNKEDVLGEKKGVVSVLNKKEEAKEVPKKEEAKEVHKK